MKSLKWLIKLHYNLKYFKYSIQPDYHAYSYKRTVNQINSIVFRLQPVYFFVYFFIKAYVVGTTLNYIDLLILFKCVPTTYAFIKKIRGKNTNHCINTIRYVIC